MERFDKFLGITPRQRKLWFYISVGILTIVFLAIPLAATKLTFGWIYDERTGVIGDTIGGITGPMIATIGAILTFFAFFIQYRANEQQRKAIAIEQFENKFFELLRMHRENIQRIEVGETIGLGAMKHLSKGYANSISACRQRDDENKFSGLELLKISFVLFYEGINATTKAQLSKTYVKSGEVDRKSILFGIFTDLSSAKRYLSEQDTALESYFRHLFQLVSFLDKQGEGLTMEEFSFYSDTISSQITSYETILILGRASTERKWIYPNNLIEKFKLRDNFRDDQKSIISPDAIIKELLNEK